MVRYTREFHITITTLTKEFVTGAKQPVSDKQTLHLKISAPNASTVSEGNITLALKKTFDILRWDTLGNTVTQNTIIGTLHDVLMNCEIEVLLPPKTLNITNDLTGKPA